MEFKKLKFVGDLPDLIISGKKNTTWRVEDDKNLCVGDKILFLRSENLTQFAVGLLTCVVEKTFGELTESDWDGHEKFLSDCEMYKTYSRYYSKDINCDSKLKIIKFRILEFM